MEQLEGDVDVKSPVNGEIHHFVLVETNKACEQGNNCWNNGEVAKATVKIESNDMPTEYVCGVDALDTMEQLASPGAWGL